MLNLRLNDNTINKNKSTDQTISYTHLDLPSVGFRSNEEVVGGKWAENMVLNSYAILGIKCGRLQSLLITA